MSARWSKSWDAPSGYWRPAGAKDPAGSASRRQYRMLKEGDRIRLVREVILQRPDCAADPACRSVRGAEAEACLLIDDGKVRLRTCGVKADIRRGDRGSGRRDQGPQGRQHARHPAAAFGDDAQGPARSGCGAAIWAWTGSRCLSCSGRTMWPNCSKIVSGPRRRSRQDRKAQGAGVAAGNPRTVRCADGGARRSGRGAAAGDGARPAEANHPRRAQGRQAGGGRDADAGIDDRGARADPRGSVRCGNRGVRRRRCGDAVGRNRPRASIRSKRWR